MKEERELIILNDTVENEILTLPADMQAKFLRITELLITLGANNIGMPHVKHLDDKLWEIRLTGKENIARSIYFITHKKQIVILHTFIKKTQKTPKKALEIAKQRMKRIDYDKI
jgi:phage-related protein